MTPIHAIERLAVAIATTVAGGGFLIPGADEHVHLPLERIGMTADLVAGSVFAYKAWAHRRQRRAGT